MVLVRIVSITLHASQRLRRTRLGGGLSNLLMDRWVKELEGERAAGRTDTPIFMLLHETLLVSWKNLVLSAPPDTMELEL